MTAIELYSAYMPIAGSIASFLTRCRREGITVEEALAAYDEYIGELAKSMRPAAAAAKKRELLCPRCGGPLEIRTLCPHVSQHWRTQMACLSDTCGWHALSVHGRAFLAAHGLDGNTEVG